MFYRKRLKKKKKKKNKVLNKKINGFKIKKIGWDMNILKIIIIIIHLLMKFI